MPSALWSEWRPCWPARSCGQGSLGTRPWAEPGVPLVPSPGPDCGLTWAWEYCLVAPLQTPGAFLGLGCALCLVPDSPRAPRASRCSCEQVSGGSQHASTPLPSVLDACSVIRGSLGLPERRDLALHHSEAQGKISHSCSFPPSHPDHPLPGNQGLALQWKADVYMGRTSVDLGRGGRACWGGI